METFRFRHWPIACTRAGTGDPLLMLHNGGGSQAVWRGLSERLEPRHEVFALDLFGYEASAKPEHGSTLDNYVALVDAFVAAHELAPVTLVGNCIGSAIALRFAIERPQAVRSLVLMNPLTEATLSAGGLRGIDALRQRVPGSTARLYGRLGDILLPAWACPLRLRASVDAGARAREQSTVDAGARSEARHLHHHQELCDCYSSRGQLRSLLAALDDAQSYAALDRFEPREDFPPICTIWGADNELLSPAAGRVLNRTLRPQREAWLSGCGHLPMLEQSERVGAIIEEFLRACDRPRTQGVAALARGTLADANASG